MKAPVRRFAVALAAIAAWGTAAAAPRITIGPVRGDAKAAVPTQLATALCGAFECVLWPQVATRRQPDLAKAKRLGIGGILTGTISDGPEGKTASLSVLTTSTSPARTWSFQLTPEGTLRTADLRQLERELRAVFRPATAPPVATPVPAARRAPVPAPQAPRPPPPREQAAPAQAAAPAAPAATPVAAAEPARRARPLLAAELGFFVVQRKLSYGGLSTMSGTLQAFDALAIGGPRLRLEAFPGAGSPSALLGGAGLFADYAMSVGLKTVAPSGEKRTSSYSRLELGVTWRAPPLGSLELVLAPRLSYQLVSLTVTPTITGLPDAGLSGVAIGIGAEAPVGDRVVLLAGVGYVKWLSAKDLIKGSPAYFPGGAAWGLEAELGVGVALWGPFSLRVLGEYATTRYSLDPDPTGTYAASSAEDRRLGARAMVRGEF